MRTTKSSSHSLYSGTMAAKKIVLAPLEMSQQFPLKAKHTHTLMNMTCFTVRWRLEDSSTTCSCVGPEILRKWRLFFNLSKTFVIWQALSAILHFHIKIHTLKLPDCWKHLLDHSLLVKGIRVCLKTCYRLHQPEWHGGKQ